MSDQPVAGNPMEELTRRAQAKTAENTIAALNTAKVESKTYYSNISGSSYYFKNGDRAIFSGGVYITDRQFEIDELDALVKHPGNHHIYDHEVPVQNPSDALVLKDVGKGSGTGMVTSAALAALAASTR